MKTPPSLLGVTLLFWGWQTGFWLVGALMAVALESARWVKVRWEFSVQDFNRIWTFCALMVLAAAVYAFTSNDGPAALGGYFQNPTVSSSHHAGTATSRAAANWLQWQPMFFFLFLLAQSFNSHEGVPVETVSLLLRLRWKRLRKPGQAETSGRTVNVAYPFFGVCLLAASAHASENSSYYWGLAALLGWGLWPLGSPRFHRVVWAGMLVIAVALGYAGQLGLGQLQRYLEGFNPQWFSRMSNHGTDPLQSRTELGHIGRLKLSGAIVLRLEQKAGPPPVYLREASYHSYRTPVWYSEVNTNELQPVNAETNGNTYVLVRGKTNVATVSIASYLPGGNGLLALPSGSGTLENLAVIEVEKSPFGAVRAQGPGLVIFDAHYGPGPTIDVPPGGDLSVPVWEIPALDRTVAQLHLGGQTDEQKLRALKGFFAEKFTYSLWQSSYKVRSNRKRSGDTPDTPLSRFLDQTHSGHCEYFATAATLLLRRMHIPARYAVGYAVTQGAGRKYVVRQRDAHAWCLVWNKDAGIWEDFDPTPASWVQEEAGRASAFEAVSDLWSWLSFQFMKLRWGQTHIRQYVLWILSGMLALMLYRILFRSQRRRHRSGLGSAGGLPEWPGLDSEFYQLEARLVERGIARQPGEGLSCWLARASAAPEVEDLRDSLEALLRLHYRLRFDPLGLDQQERETLRRDAATCLNQLNR